MIHIHNTRNREHLNLELTHSSLGQRSIKFKGSCLWNSVPDELKSCHTCSFICKTFKEFYAWQVLSSTVTVFRVIPDIFMYYSMTSYIVVNYACVPIPVCFSFFLFFVHTWLCMYVCFLSVSLSLWSVKPYPTYSSVCLILTVYIYM